MEKITIKDFRCYSEKTMEFRPCINLLIGDNAVGKTSLLRACNYVNNAFFAGFSDENTHLEKLHNEDFRSVADNISKKEDKPVEIHFTISDKDFYPIQKKDNSMEPLLFGEEYVIKKTSKKNKRYLLTGIKNLKITAKKLQQNQFSDNPMKPEQINALPVYACFTTEDIHSKRKIERVRFKEYIAKPSLGYYMCYDCRGLLDYWLYRMLILSEGFDDSNLEIDNVKKAVQSALGERGCNIISQIMPRPMRKSVFFKFTDGRIVESNLLSDGYRRLVNIVVDLAFRCALLNKGIYGEDAYKKTHGTVIIDEIDEHLHPELQVRILKALHETFPKIQFIVSTHAPLVMSSVETNENNVVYKLEFKDGVYSHKELNTYGLDANLLLKESMKVSVRDAKVSKLFESLDSYLKNKELVNAKSTLSELEKLTDPQQPELVRYRAIINRIELIGR